ncbi:3'-5' exonuclease [Wielerella bovis]|uniref:3'-5' exonuclease n=1 Tax=Wielerella bovis TaxID=2917790 RepID=UPI0020187831|nr:3'-5' exonuclease [Wielerella bovis]ULJ64185.1 3'-5' exonuclease [Wielerella bovis]
MFGFNQHKKRVLELEQELEQLRSELKQAQDELRKRIEFDDENQRIKQLANNLLAQNALILDTETTGLGNNTNSQIIELAIIDVQGNVLFNSLIKPKNKMSKDNKSIAVHGIRNEILVYSPEWSDVHEKIAGILQNRQVVSYNGAFNQAMIEQTYKKYGLPCPEFTMHCAMDLYSAWYGHLSQYALYRSKKLVEAMTLIYGGYWEQAHRALPDCQAVLDLLKFVAANNMRPRFFE